MLEAFLNPVVIGGAIGATVVLFAIGMLVSRAFKKGLGEGIALFVGFLIAGCGGTGLSAYGFADGGDPVWLRAAYAYGLPSIVAAVASLVAYNFFGGKPGSDSSSSVTMIALFCLAVAAIVGQRFSLIEEHYSDDRLLFSDPLTAGFAAVEDEYPDIWGDFAEKAKNVDMFGGDAAGLAVEFFQQHQGTFMANGSDESAADLMRAVVSKMKSLRPQHPDMCVSVGSGVAPTAMLDVLSYDVKLREAEALEALVRSKGQPNSGIASQAEAEAVVIDVFTRLAKEDPVEFYGLVEASQGIATDNRTACEAYIRFQELTLDRPLSEFARMIRHPINWDDNYAFSADAERELALASLHAEVGLAMPTLPQKLDASTTWVGMSYQNERVAYDYEVSAAIGDGGRLRSFFEENTVPSVCNDADIRWMIDLGVVIDYTYIGTDGGTVEMHIDSGSCD